jgi:hypothetical protein
MFKKEIRTEFKTNRAVAQIKTIFPSPAVLQEFVSKLQRSMGSFN